MPIYSPTGFLDITNATLRTSNLEAQNFRLNGGNIYVTSELTTNELLNLDNVVNAGNTTSNTVQFKNTTTGLVVDSNIVVAGNVTAGSFLGDGSGLTSIPPSAITGTLSQWSDGTNSDVYIASNVGIGNVHTLTSNTLQVGANLYVRDADANVLTVTGNVAADYFEGDGSKLTGISSTLQAITDSGNVTSNTVQFSNATTGFVTTSNIEVGGALKINTITAAAYHALSAVTAVGASTGDTIQLTNATTGLVTTANVDVGKDLNVTGNLNVLGTRTIVDTDTLRVKDPIIELGKDNPGTGDLGLVMTRPSGSSNVAIIFDENADTLEIGYTQSNASDTDITMRTAATEPLDVNVNGNVSVGKELTVTGNVAVDTDTLFVDSVNDRVGVGTTDPTSKLHIVDDNANTKVTIRGGGTTVNNSNVNIELFETASDFYGATIQYCGTLANQGLRFGHHVITATPRFDMAIDRGTGNVGIGTTDPIGKLDVRGTIIAPVVSYQYNQDAPYLIAGTSGYTGAATNWDTHGFQHRIKTNSGGVPRITVDAPDGGEVFSIVNGGNIGIGTTSPVGVNGGQRLEGSSSTGFEYIATRDDITGVADDFVGAYLFKNADTDGNEPHYAGMSAKMTGTNGPMDLRFHTNRDQYESDAVPAMTINQLGNVGIGTSSPLNTLHLSSSNTSLDASGSATFDQYSLIIHNTRGSGSNGSELGLCFNHYDSSYPSSTRTPGAAITHERTTSWSKGKLHFKTKSANTESGSCDTRMTIDESGNVGIGTTSPSRKLDVHSSARPSNYPFAIGGTGTNKANYVAVTVNPGNNKTSFTKDFVFGGSQRPNWIRVHAGGAAAVGAAASAALQYALYAEFTVAVNGTTAVSNRRSGDGGISVAASGSTNGIRVTINGGTNGSYARAWIEVYSENGVYW